MLSGTMGTAAAMRSCELQYDGFLRIELGVVLSSRFIHLFSGLSPLQMCSSTGLGNSCLASGFSEWQSLNSRPMSLSWDWAVAASKKELTVARVGLPRSNIMLVDCKGCDYGWLESLEVLATVVDALPWQQEIWSKRQNLSPA